MMMSDNNKGLLFGDKGYISKPLFLALYKRGLKLVTGVKKRDEKLPFISRRKDISKKALYCRNCL